MLIKETTTAKTEPRASGDAKYLKLRSNCRIQAVFNSFLLATCRYTVYQPLLSECMLISVYLSRVYFQRYLVIYSGCISNGFDSIMIELIDFEHSWKELTGPSLIRLTSIMA